MRAGALLAAAAAASSAAADHRLLLALHRGSGSSSGSSSTSVAFAASLLRPRPQLRMMSSSSKNSPGRPAKKRVVVIGAGMSGLTAARTLLELAPAPGLLQLTLLEKSTSNGRCATREVAGLGGSDGKDVTTFDHGAPGFSAVTPAFRRQVEAWTVAGDGGVVVPFAGQANYYRGRPTMRSLPLHLAQGLDVRRPVLIERVERAVAGGEGGWVLYPQGGGSEWEADAVVVAIPPEQSAALLDGVAGAEALQAAIAGVKSEPCITVMLAVPAAAGAAAAEEIVKFPPGSDPVLVKAVRRRQGGLDCWVAHTTRAFTEQYIYTSAEAFEKQAVVDGVLAAMRGAGLLPPAGAAPVHADAQRWLYSQTHGPVAGVACGWEPRLQLGVCGDGWAGPREGEAGLEGVERAWLSGRAVGEAMAGEWWGTGDGGGGKG